MLEKPVALPVPDVLPSWTSRQLVGGTLTVFAVAAAFWFLIRFYQLIFILIVAIILARLCTFRLSNRAYQPDGQKEVAAFSPRLVLRRTSKK